MVGDNSNPDTQITLGMEMQSFWLECVKMKISLQPVSKVLENTYYADDLKANLGENNSLMIVFRAGYVKNYGTNNKIRRPLKSFVKATTE